MARRARGHAVPVARLRRRRPARGGQRRARASSRSATRTTRPASCSAVDELAPPARRAARARRRAARRGAARLRRRRGPRRRPARSARSTRACSSSARFSKAWGLAGPARAATRSAARAPSRCSSASSPTLGLNELAQAGALEALRTPRDLAERRGRRVIVERPPRPGCDALRGPARRSSRPSQANVAVARRPGPRRAPSSPRAWRAAASTSPPAAALGDPDHVRVAISRPTRTELLRAPASARSRASALGAHAGGASPAAGLAQQRARRLLEDLAPGARGLLARAVEVLDDLAHPRGRDLDAVALGDLA